MHRYLSGYHPAPVRVRALTARLPSLAHPALCDRLIYLVMGLSLPLTLPATEGGTTAFPNGAEDYLVAAMPPPGWYGWLTYNHYSADRFADDSGHMPFQSFALRVDAIVPRFDWVKPVAVLGADRWGTLFLLPGLNLDLLLRPAPGVSVKGRKHGLGDITLGNGLHWTFAAFDMVNAFDVTAPTGSYDPNDPVNPGQNKWVVRLNHMGTWHPASAWDVSYRLHWDYNFNNPAGDYRSGQTLYLNWAVGWKPRPPVTVGIVGYLLRQITDDRQGGHRVGPDGNRLRVDGIGPCIKYILPNHAILTVKYFREFAARNHPKGEQLWLQTTVPLG